MSLHMSLVLTVDHYYVRIGLQCIPEVLTIPFVLSIRIVIEIQATNPTETSTQINLPEHSRKEIAGLRIVQLMNGVARARTFTKESTEKPKRCDAVNVHARSEQPSGGSNLARICAAHFLPSLARRPLFFPRHTTSCATGVLFTLDVTADSTILSTFFSLLFFFFSSFFPFSPDSKRIYL